MNVPYTFKRTRRILAFCLAGLLPASVTFAQEAATDEQIVRLSEFRVDTTSDDGYRATNTISGTMLNTPIRETPFSIDVYTEEFISDLGAANFREVLQYDSSSVLDNTFVQGFGTGGFESGDNIVNQETDVKIRGFPVPSMVNGLRTQVRIDTVNLGRIERAGGPSSLLYGVGALSGVTNNLSKLPTEFHQGAVSASVGSWGFQRYTGDFSGPVTDRIGYRVTAAHTREGSRVDYRDTTTQFGSFLTEINPWATTRLVLEANITKRNDRGTEGPTDIGMDIQDPVTGDNYSWLRDGLQMGRNVNVSGPDTYRNYDNNLYRFELIQEFGDHVTLLLAGQREDFDQERRSIENLELTAENELRYAWNLNETERTVDQARANLLTSFHALGADHNVILGRQEYSETNRVDLSQPWFRNYATNAVDFPQYHGSPTMHDTPLLGRQPLSPTPITYRGEPYVPHNVNRELGQWIQGHYAIYQGKFWDERIVPVLGYRWERVHNKMLDTAMPGHFSTRAQNDRIWPRTSFEQPDQGGEQFDPLTGRETTEAGYSNKGRPLRNETGTAAVSFRLHDQVTLFAQYGQATALPSTAQRDGAGEAFNVQESKNREIGVKFDLWDGRISGRVSAFDLDRVNAVRYAWFAPAPWRGNFDSTQPVTWNIGATGIPTQTWDGHSLEARVYHWDDPADRAALQNFHAAALRNGADGIAFVGPQGGGNNTHGDRGGYVNFDENAKGYEVSFDISPIDNYSARLAYTYNDVVVTKGMTAIVNDPDFRSPFHAVFQNLGFENFENAPNPNDPSSFVPENADASSFRGEVLGGFKKSDTPLHTVTFWNRYAFTEGAIAGTTVGFGSRYQSSRATDFNHGRNDRPNETREDLGGFVNPDVPSSLLFDAFASYQTNLMGYDWSLQLNVRNLLNNQKLQAIAQPPAGSTETLPRTSTLYLEPREFRLSATMRF